MSSAGGDRTTDDVGERLVDAITRAAETNSPVAIAIGGVVAAIAVSSEDGVSIPLADLATIVGRTEPAGPRWVWWSAETATALLDVGVRIARCWDLSAVHRLLVGGWASDPARVWAHARGLDVDRIPTVRPVDLFHQVDDETDVDDPVRRDGYLRPDWATGRWDARPDRIVRWAELALVVQQGQEAALEDLGREAHVGASRDPGHLRSTALAESAAEVLGAELAHGGLPFDRSIGESIVAGFVGARPRDAGEEQDRLRELDDTVLARLPAGATFDLRRPDQVKSMLRRVGIEVPDTRAWRLEAIRDAHPVVEPLLAWRRAERVRTTFGYHWIDEHVGSDGRLRGAWHASDGAAGRMTATAGLHNMPAEMRPAVVAEPGHRFVRADLGQIEPRVLAAVSADPQLIAATLEDDMYAPVAARLGVDRSVAKVAVLGAMYGQTTGIGAEALRGLEREYPIAMGYLRRADEAAQGGHDLRTYGGRRIQMSAANAQRVTTSEARSRAAARGRYGRNAMVQGAAAEFFKMWAVLVRARGTELDARIVLCLHDELIVHVAADAADATAQLLVSCLEETAHRWSPPSGDAVRFVADVSVVERWSDAK